MPTLSILKTYNDGDILLEADLDNIRSAVLTFLNTTKIDSDNIQDDGVLPTKIACDETTIDGTDTTLKVKDGGIDTTQLASDAVDGSKIADESIDSEHYVDESIDEVHIADDAVTTNKIANSAVDTDQLAAGAVTGTKLALGAVTNLRIADDAVTSSKILDQSITKAKLAINSTVQSSVVTDSGGAGVFEEITTVSLNLAGTERPILIYIAGGSTDPAHLGLANTTGDTAQATVRILRGTTEIYRTKITTISGGASSSTMDIPPGAIQHIDSTPGSSTVTYTLEARLDSGTYFTVADCRLSALVL